MTDSTTKNHSALPPFSDANFVFTSYLHCWIEISGLTTVIGHARARTRTQCWILACPLTPHRSSTGNVKKQIDKINWYCRLLKLLSISDTEDNNFLFDIQLGLLAKYLLRYSPTPYCYSLPFLFQIPGYKYQVCRNKRGMVEHWWVGER